MDTVYGVRDPTSAILALREDLVFTPRRFGNQPCYVIEDPLRSKFFRVGLREFTLISLLDGKTSIGAAVGLAASALGPQALSNEEALGLCRWLVDAQLASTRESSQGPRLVQAAGESARARLRALVSPLVIKVPLVNPDRLLDAVAPAFGWLLGLPFFLVWTVVLVYSLYRVWACRDDLAAASLVVIDPDNWFRLAAAWLALKLVHEFCHALACKKYGGNVSRAGILFILLAPVAYVDVTTSWRFRSKWQRIATAAAGIYIELLAAAVAVIVWSHTREGPVHRLCWDIALMASLHTLVFNANPLLRFDGYYILSDLVGIPNLYASGRQYVWYLVERYVFGLDAVLPAWPARKGLFIKAYGIAALVWRMLLYAMLVVALVGLLGYAGLLLAAILAIWWFGIPSFRGLRRLLQARAARQPSRRRLFAAALLALCLVLAGGVLVQRPAAVSAPAVVEYSPLTAVRAASPGFVRQIRLGGGDAVRAGQIIAVLANEELDLALADLGLAVEQSRLKSRVYYESNDLVKHQVEAANREALEKKKREAQDEVESLTIRAPATGRIIARSLESLSGQYLRAGDPVALIGSEDAKELLVAIPQEDIDLYLARLGTLVDVQVRGVSGRLRAPLVKVSPRASVELVHPALSARAGGRLAVRSKPAPRDASAAADQAFELVAPRFTGTVTLSPEQSQLLGAGQPATVTFRSAADTIARRLYRSAERSIRHRLRQP